MIDTIGNNITLTNSPTDYNLPYPSWYENQRTMAERAAKEMLYMPTNNSSTSEISDDDPG